nr:B-4DMT family transporter [Amycolatopsis australiensis]
MSAWVIRGLGMAVLHGVALTLLAKYAVYHPTDQTLAVSLVLAVLVGAAALWSALDAWRGRPDRGRAWFVAALVAGVVSGILYVIGRAVFVDQTGVSELGGALTGGAAFSALLVLVPAGLGLFVGGRIGRGQQAAEEDGEDEVREAPSPRPRVQPSVSPRPRVRPSGAGSAGAGLPGDGPSPRPRVRPSGAGPSGAGSSGGASAGAGLPGDGPSPRPRRRVGPRGEEPRA